MRTITDTYQVYTYAELSETAKDTAKELYLEWKGDDAFIFTEDCEYYLAERFPNSDLKVEYSLSYCQGDGLNIYGDISLTDIWNDIDKSVFTDKEKKFMEWALREYGRAVKLPANWHYCYCNSSQWDFTSDMHDDMEYNAIRNINEKALEKFEEAAKEHLENVCSILEKDGYSFFYDIPEDDELSEYFGMNEHEFYSDGRLYC